MRIQSDKLRSIPRDCKLLVIGVLSFIQPGIFVVFGAVAYLQSGWLGVIAVSVIAGAVLAFREINRVRRRQIMLRGESGVTR